MHYFICQYGCNQCWWQDLHSNKLTSAMFSNSYLISKWKRCHRLNMQHTENTNNITVFAFTFKHDDKQIYNNYYTRQQNDPVTMILLPEIFLETLKFWINRHSLCSISLEINVHLLCRYSYFDGSLQNDNHFDQIS